MYTTFLFLALTTSAPQVDVKAICTPARVAALPEDKAGAYDECVREENAAHDTVRQMWGKFTARARTDCVYPGPVPESYVEMLTCLQMESGLGFGGATAGAGSGALPAPKDLTAAPSKDLTAAPTKDGKP